jgi:trans-aconitate 2-methyltransferase
VSRPASTPRSAGRWDAAQYLKFERERTLPCRDLVARLNLPSPSRIVDLGCGPGTSTAVLHERWPDAEVTGVDRSAEMLDSARASHPGFRWIESDLARWEPDGSYPLVFSNAALQWIDDHPHLIPRLWSWVPTGGALAFQVPARQEPRPGWIDALEALLRRPRWATSPPYVDAATPVLPIAAYSDLLGPESTRLELWDTEYVHVFSAAKDVVEWVRGTGLRPWLQALRDDQDREAFLADFTAEVALRYPTRDHGRVLFPFLRRFVIAYR